jgi:hypothetical protein
MSNMHSNILSWLAEPVVIIHMRRGRSAVLPDDAEIIHTAGLIQVRINDAFRDEREGGESDSDSMAGRMAVIIDEFTPL